MPWLWIVPIVLSGLFDHNSPSRKRSIVVYTFVSSFFFCGTLVFSIPRSSSFVGMILPTLFLVGPLNLLVALVIEKASQYLFQLLRISENSSFLTAAVYCEAYCEAVEQKLAQFGPTAKVKDLTKEAELQIWIKEGRFKRVESFPLKQGTTEITLSGYKTSGGQACFRGEPSKFLFYATVPEKKNALVVINDDSIWIFTESGQLLQSVDYESYRQMGITEDVLLANH